MTPKEKAIELITKFRLFQSISYDEDGGSVNNYNISRHNAKQCALICVEEILKSFEGFMDQRRNFRHELEIEAERYWQSVKTEIEKL